jgi:hypothetical protein
MNACLVTKIEALGRETPKNFSTRIIENLAKIENLGSEKLETRARETPEIPAVMNACLVTKIEALGRETPKNFSKRITENFAKIETLWSDECDPRDED